MRAPSTLAFEDAGPYSRQNPNPSEIVRGTLVTGDPLSEFVATSSAVEPSDCHAWLSPGVVLVVLDRASRKAPGAVTRGSTDTTLLSGSVGSKSCGAVDLGTYCDGGSQICAGLAPRTGLEQRNRKTGHDERPLRVDGGPSPFPIVGAR